MIPVLHHLISLQNLDLEIRGLLQSQEELPQTMRELEAKLAELRDTLAAKQQELEEVRKQHRQLDQEMAMLDEGITRSRQRLMEIKDNIEYKAMLKEIAFKEDRKDQKETEVLQVLEQMEALTAALADLQQEVAVREANLETLRSEVAAELVEQEAKIAGLQEQRQEIQQQIPASLLKRYNFIREKRQGVALAEVRQGVCQACHMNLPPQKFIELQMDQELMTCPHCQRIIYFIAQEENGSADPAQAA